ncbi:MAG: SOS response-associated peptidase [Syntrophaceae bacterium]|jgi:putative SOS response-associated peptidase YedK|nr:SOS response-associated peptidase [Syntrophaceae bacterium]
MCGRFVLVTDFNKISGQFQVRNEAEDFSSNREVFYPGQDVPAVVRQNGQNHIVFFRWGLIPSWAKDPSIGRKLINARAETVFEKPSFRKAFQKRRCLIVADGFYEWQKEEKRKIAWRFFLKSEKPFGMAGLYESWRGSEKQALHTCVILTTEANLLVRTVHDRMPVIVAEDQWRTWLSEEAADRAALVSLFQPYPAEWMDCRKELDFDDERRE